MIFIKYGNNPQEMMGELLDKAEILKDIPGSNSLIGIKPNLVVAKPSESGATTCPALTKAVIEYLKSKGFNNIVILEGSWIGDSTAHAFKVCGYENISKKYGIPLIDLQKDESKVYYVGDESIHVCKKAMDIDYMINLPVLKGHCQTRITCALKNMKGCVPDKEKRRFHSMGLHKPIAYLNKVLKQDLVIVDGIIGDLNFEEGGNPVQMNRIIVGKDPVHIDSYVAQLLGYDKKDIPYIAFAEALGVGDSHVKNKDIVELNKDSSTAYIIPKTRQIKNLERYIREDMACSSCYSSLIHALDRMKDRGDLNKIKEKIHIGQSYKNKTFDGIGVGMCTRNLMKSLPGCPPKAKDILDFLDEII